MALFSPSRPVYHPLPPEDKHAARSFPTRFASADIRGVAAVVDLMLLIIVYYPSQLLVGLHPRFREVNEKLMALNDEKLQGVYDNNDVAYQDLMYQYVFEQMSIHVPIQLLCLAPIIIFYVYGWRKWGATPGKWLFGLRIVNAQDGGPLSWPQCIKRSFGYVLSVAPFMLGFLWINVNKRRCSWHDYAAGTVVLKCKSRYLKSLKQQMNDTPPADALKGSEDGEKTYDFDEVDSAKL